MPGPSDQGRFAHHVRLSGEGGPPVAVLLVGCFVPTQRSEIPPQGCDIVVKIGDKYDRFGVRYQLLEIFRGT